MLNTVKAIVKEGRIELMEQVHIPEGAEVLVTILSDDAEFWLRASEPREVRLYLFVTHSQTYQVRKSGPPSLLVPYTSQWISSFCR
jgi:hypothetical protein